MSEGGGYDGALWELNQSWGFSNSDDSAGSEEKSGKKIPESSSNSQTEIGMEKAAPPRKKKRGQGGTDSKDGNGCGSQGKEEGKAGGESDHEIHIWTERERRKKMRNMFANLHALLPQLPPKVKLLLLRDLRSMDIAVCMISLSLSLCSVLQLIKRECPFH